MANKLLLNLAFLLKKSTGTTTCARDLLKHLQELQPLLLTSQIFSDYNCYTLPTNQTSEQPIIFDQ